MYTLFKKNFLVAIVFMMIFAVVPANKVSAAIKESTSYAGPAYRGDKAEYCLNSLTQQGAMITILNRTGHVRYYNFKIYNRLNGDIYYAECCPADYNFEVKSDYLGTKSLKFGNLDSLDDPDYIKLGAVALKISVYDKEMKHLKDVDLIWAP